MVLLLGAEGYLLSVKEKAIVKTLVCFAWVLNEKSPVGGSKAAPAGRPVAESVMAPPMLTDVAVTVKLIHVPAVTVWFPGTVSVGGIKASTLRVMLAEVLACGEAESLTVTMAV